MFLVTAVSTCRNKDRSMKTYLQNLHEASDIELRVQRQVMNIGDEYCNLLFQSVEPFFKRLVGLVCPVVVTQVVVRTRVLGIVRLARFLAFEIGAGMVLGLDFGSDQTFDVGLCLSDAL